MFIKKLFGPVYQQFSILEKFYLLWAWLVYKLYLTVPKSFYETRNLFEYLDKNNVVVEKEGKENNIFYRLNNKNYKIKIRRSTSDIAVFHQIIINEEFKGVLDLIKENNIQINTIVDAGANIGISSLYFHSEFNDASILLIEPNQENFQICQENINSNIQEKAICVKAGLWSKKTLLVENQNFGDGRHWAFSVKEAESEFEQKTMESISPDMCFEILGVKEIDLFKIDIEGAELELLINGDNSFLEKTKIVAVEIHDKGRIGEVIDLMSTKHFSYNIVGEYHLFINGTY